jgi:hypothetical protein
MALLFPVNLQAQPNEDHIRPQSFSKHPATWAPGIPRSLSSNFGNDTPYSTKLAVVKKKPKLNRFTYRGAGFAAGSPAPSFGIDLFGLFWLFPGKKILTLTTGVSRVAAQ